MRHFVLVFIILNLLEVQLAFSKENFEKGYVITKYNDTLRGYIDYKGWRNNPKTINFRNELSGNDKTFTPQEVKEFFVANEYYISRKVELEVSKNSIDELDYSRNLLLDSAHVFLQTLVKGEKSLYMYVNSMNKPLFYISDNNQPVLLKYKRYLKSLSEKLILQENKDFVGQLLYYFSDVPGLQSEINNLNYDEKRLIVIFEKYCKNKGKQIQFKRNAEVNRYEIGIIAGMSYTNFYFVNGFYNPQKLNSVFTGSINPTIGLFYNFILHENQGKWSVNNELIYNSYEVKGYFKDYTSDNQFTVYNSKLAYNYLKIYNMIRYRYLFSGFNIFFNAGISNGFAITETNKLNKFTKFYTTETTVDGKFLEETRKYEQGVIFGTGVGFKHLSVEFRAEFSNGISAWPILSTDVDRYNVLIGYKF